MWQEIVVAAIVIGALVLVARRYYKTAVDKRPSCGGCGGCATGGGAGKDLNVCEPPRDIRTK
jgi:hypothetical protein